MRGNMEKLHYSSELTEAYGIKVDHLNSQKHALPATFITRALIEPGKKTQLHSHFEKEFYLVVSGNGLLRSSLQSLKTDSNLSIRKGDLVSVNAFSAHEILNQGQDDLEILSLTSSQKDRPALPESMLITTAPPTPNGPLHLGHASGPYLGADLLAKYLKSRKVAVKSVFYTDDHQNYVRAKANTLNRDVEAVAKEYREEILSGLQGLDAQADEILNISHNSFYKLRVQQLFDSLLEKGVIEIVDSALPYCLHCQEILVDAFLAGECPQCSNSTSGSCEECGHYAAPDEVHNAHCAKCKITAHLKNVKVARLDLEKSRTFLESYIEKTHMSLKLKEKLHTLLKNPLPKLLITHPANYGIQVRHPNLMGQVFHVWFEMAAGQDFIRTKHKDSEWAHFFGFDNAFFYSLAIPAILEAYKTNYPLPTHLYANEFLELDGKKFSTSRSHALWLNEELERMGKDFLRMALHYQSPQNSRSSVSLEALLAEKTKISEQLSRMLSLASVVSEASELRIADLNNEEKDFYINTHLRVREAEESLHPLFYNRRSTVRAALRLMLEIEDFKKDFLRSAQGKALLRMALKALGQIMKLLAPDFSKTLATKIDLPKQWQRDF